VLIISLPLSLSFEPQYAAKDFGSCALIQCAGQTVLPVGLKDEMGADAVRMYCPKCHQLYHPPPVISRASNGMGVDGAAFGETFPHLFLMTFSNLVPDPVPMEGTYVPRIFGFRVYKSAQQRQSSVTANVAANANANAANDVAVNVDAALNVTRSSNSVHALPLVPANLNGLMNGFARKEEDEEPETNAALAAPQAVFVYG
jgi:hypothetical protein